MNGQHRVGALVELPQVLRELGADPDKLISKAGVDPSVLRNHENSLPFADLGTLFHVCATETGCEHLGLLVGQRSGTGCLGLVGRLMQNMPTLGDAILALCTNQQRYTRGAVTYIIVEDACVFWGYAVYQHGIQAIEQISDAALAIGANMMRELAGLPADEILTSRPAPADVAPYRAFFGCTPQFDAEQLAIVIPEKLLATPVAGADPKLRAILEKSVADYWALRQPSVADQVMRLLRPRVVFEGSALEDVARALSMHPRTLNRRLEAEGTTFRRLVNQARFEVARQLLANTRLRITNIAFALGYADTAAFSHAFQRWSGRPPSDWRVSL